ncbi:MAG TPA: YbdD/YjiX family protein [Gammaproteobacteria bacterium]|nr:YbdD/YjiX family protein [Gammaproteobacteria bacterium]
MRKELKTLAHGLRQMAYLMVGLPDYEAYADHMRRAHPERPPMSRGEFFRERQAARYRGGSGRCC